MSGFREFPVPPNEGNIDTPIAADDGGVTEGSAIRATALAISRAPLSNRAGSTAAPTPAGTGSAPKGPSAATN